MMNKSFFKSSSPSPSSVINRVNSSAKDWGLSVEDKWKIVSHMHKAIRHGRPDDAEQGARWLYELDPAYLRYRLAVIGQEDVAGGNAGIVAEAFADGWDRFTFEKKGIEFVVKTVRTWSESVKDRTACAFIDCAFYLDEFEQKWGSWALLSSGAARRIAFNAENQWWERGLGAWRAAGADVFKSSHLPKVKGNWDSYIQEAIDFAQLTDEEIACIQAGQKNQVEPHTVFLPLVFEAKKREENLLIKPWNVPDLGYVGPYISAALDKHTAEGKEAVENLIRDKPQEFKSLTSFCSKQQASDLIARLWFWMEGGRLDQSWDYRLSRMIDLEGKKKRLKEVGVEPNLLYELFGKDLGAWQKARLLTNRKEYKIAAPKPRI